MTVVALLVVAVAVAPVTDIRENQSILKDTALIGRSSIPGCSLLLIEMNLDQSAACCVNSINDTKMCKGVMLEHGLSSLVVFFERT